MSSTHTLHDFMLSHRSKLVMATTTTSTTNTGQRIVPKAHKISMSSNRFGLVEIVEVIRTSDQVEMVNHLENDIVSTNIDTVGREPRASATVLQSTKISLESWSSTTLVMHCCPTTARTVASMIRHRAA